MQKFRTPEPTPDCPFPKPQRIKTGAGRKIRLSKKEKTDSVQRLGLSLKVSDHDLIVAQCVEVLQDAYPEYSFLHIPNCLYELITGKPEGRYYWVFEKCLGKKESLILKTDLGLAFRYISDLTVFSPKTTLGYKLCMNGEVKTGNAKPRQAQKKWALGDLRVWRSANMFKDDMHEFHRAVQEHLH